MTGMDPKILAAVFASIAAITVGTGGSGDIESFQDIEPSKILENFDSPSTDFLKNFNRNPVPNNSVTVTVQPNSGNMNLKIDSERLRLTEFEKLVSANKNITSDSDVILTDYSGTIGLTNTNMSKIKGSSSGYESSGVQVSEETKLNGLIKTEAIKAENISRNKISLKNVNFEMVAEEGTKLEKKDANFKINSFSGKANFYRNNSTLILEGKIDRFNSGGASFSG